MKVWKSPVFYFGILLVVAITGLLAAPYVVDWNSYRADLEAYGRKLTGRDVKVEGRIAVRLFPWPSLTASNVSIANPAGLSSPVFAHADRITVRMTLAGLTRGGIDVESIDVEGPEIHFERLPSGEGNWQFEPSADLIRSDVLSRVRLDQIRFIGGSVHFSDRRRGETVTLDDVNASVASPGVAGPWRIRSEAIVNDRAWSIGINTGAYVEGTPFRFGVKVAAADNSGLVYSFDGAQAGSTVEGGLRIEPATAGDGKTDVEGKFRPLVFTAKLKGDFDQVNFTDIQVSPQDQQGSALTTGSATVKLGQHITASLDLTSAMLDVDALAGARSRALVREAGSLALMDSLLKALPRDISIAAGVKVTAVKLGGETLDSVSLEAEAEHDSLRIKKFMTGLPGRSQALFRGVYFPKAGGTGSELSGALALESSDLRALTTFAWPEGASPIGLLWTGSRGRFKAQTDVSVTPSKLRLTGLRYELEGEQGQAELQVSSAGRGAVDLRIDAGRLDVDALAPNGMPALAALGGGNASGMIAMALPRADAADLRLKLSAKELVLNKVTAKDVGLDLQSGANGLDLRSLTIGAVGGATLDATGLILDNGKGPDGSIGLDVKADDPRGLLRLVGVIRGDDDPVWARSLGATVLKADLGVKPGADRPQFSFSTDGTAGDLGFSGAGSLSDQGALTASARLKAPQSGRLATLLGLTPVAPDSLPADLNLKVTGSAAEGYSAVLALQAYDARLDYQGAVDANAPRLGLNGKLALRSTDIGPLAGAAGLPILALPSGVLVADTPVMSGAAGWSFSAIDGRLGEAKFKGHASFDAASMVDARFETGPMKLSDVLAATFLDWAGSGPDLEAFFSAGLPFGLKGQLWIKPSALEVHPHFMARDAEIGITAVEGETDLALFGKDEQGRDAQIEVRSAGSDASRTLKGRLRIPVDLAKQLALVNGSPVVSGLGTVELSFDTQGRSPGGALASLKGSGSFDFADFRLLGLTPKDFIAKLAEAKDAAGITAAFDALRSGEGLDFGHVSGPVTVTAGEVGFLPFGLKTPEADVQVKATGELALGQIKADVALSLKPPGEVLPAMTVSYAGPPSALARGEDNSEISTKLGVAFMQQGIDELERLQQEQKRLAEQEEQQRIEDEARLQAYYAQRDELLLRKREVKVHAEMQAAEAERLRQQIEAERAVNAEINKSELKQRQRELRTYRRLAKLTQSTTPAPAPKPAPVKTAAESPVQTEKPVAPVILVQPPTAPVVISPAPGTSPTQ